MAPEVGLLLSTQCARYPECRLVVSCRLGIAVVESTEWKWLQWASVMNPCCVFERVRADGDSTKRGPGELQNQAKC
jgi:hypothetical protein